MKLRTESIETGGGIRVVDVETGELAFRVSSPHPNLWERRKTAELLALAPEMFEVLEQILKNSHPGSAGLAGAIDRVHELVTKARGGK